MISNQTLILDALEAKLAVLLPEYSRLAYSYDLEKNSFRGTDMSYGSGIGPADWDEGVFKSVTLDQIFFIVLTASFINRSTDESERDALKQVYDGLDIAYLDIASSKLGLPSTVLVVSTLSLDEPLKIGENTISVKANFIIKHRKSKT